MSITRKQIEQLVLKVVQEVNEELEIEELSDPKPETTLYGPDGKLDSLGLVNLVSEIEDRVEDELGEEISLADEQAMAQNTPPFATVRTLTDYISDLLDAE